MPGCLFNCRTPHATVFCCRVEVSYIFSIVLNACFELLRILFRCFWYWSLKLGPLSLIYLSFLRASYFSVSLVELNCFDLNAEILCHIERFENFLESKSE